MKPQRTVSLRVLEIPSLSVLLKHGQDKKKSYRVNTPKAKPPWGGGQRIPPPINSERSRILAQMQATLNCPCIPTSESEAGARSGALEVWKHVCPTGPCTSASLTLPREGFPSLLLLQVGLQRQESLLLQAQMLALRGGVLLRSVHI